MLRAIASSRVTLTKDEVAPAANVIPTPAKKRG
jgi:hypothetical protein